MTEVPLQRRAVPRWKRALDWLDAFADASDRRDVDDLRDRIAELEKQVAALIAERRGG